MTALAEPPTQAMASYPPNERPRVVDQIDLAALRTAVSCSRLFTKYVLSKWGAPSLTDDACLIVSELVTNAVKATGNMDEHPRWSELHDLKLVRVRLVGLENSIVFEVWDTSPEEPTLTEAGEDDEGGRGMFLVESLSKSWGSYPQPRGKVVWAELPVYTRTANGLPKRQRTASPESHVQPPSHSPELLRRIKEGLEEL